jgi:amino acid adenylation domain-containing protein
MTSLLKYYIAGGAAQSPSRTLIFTPTKSYTYEDLRNYSQTISSVLGAKNFSDQNAICATLLPKSFETIACNIGTLLAGYVFTNLDVKSPPTRLSKLITNLTPRIIFTNSLNIALLPKDLPTETQVVNLDLVETNIWTSSEHFESNLYNYSDLSPACIVNTSGSTGTPKSVVLSHSGLSDFIEWCTTEFDFIKDDNFGSLSPFFFDIYLMELFVCLKTGAQLTIIPEKLASFPDELVSSLEESAVTFIFWVPTVMVNIANLGILSNKKLNALRRVFYAGEPFPVKQLNLWRKTLPHIQFVNLYGPIEISIDCTFHVIDRFYADTESAPIGRACANKEVMVLDDNFDPVSEGEMGELYVRGVGVALGYYNSPKETSRVFFQNPRHVDYRDIVYRTGDLVKYDSDGNLEFMGRRDSQIKHLGYRIELGEIEKTCLALAEVSNACVVYDAVEKEIKLFVELSVEITSLEIRRELFKHLPKYMVPTRIHILDSLPMNPNGKIDRKMLASGFA